MNTKDSKPKTHFGFQQIDSEDKREKVELFYEGIGAPEKIASWQPVTSPPVKQAGTNVCFLI